MTPNKPRTLLVKTRTYTPVPDRFMLPDDNKELFKSFRRFPIKNPHWQTEVIEHDGQEYILESVNETAFDSLERPIHEFVENEEGIQESSTVYLEGKDGKTISVRATNGGFVSICENSEDVNFVPKDMIFISRGRRNDSCIRYDEEAQSLECSESEMERLTDDIFDDDYNCKREIVEKDPYGNPLKALTRVGDEIIHLSTYEYTYAK